VLNLNAVCFRCNAICPRGSEASLGVSERPEYRPIQCLSCLQSLRESS